TFFRCASAIVSRRADMEEESSRDLNELTTCFLSCFLYSCTLCWMSSISRSRRASASASFSTLLLEYHLRTVPPAARGNNSNPLEYGSWTGYGTTSSLRAATAL
ncbi:hypothetical protein PFISCL1PPCAC_16513, partial [Pristionchus fissidentatus]